MKLMRKIDLYSKINRLINKTGFDVRRFPSGNYRMLLKYLKDNSITDCFDVGANTGQYAKFIRSAGFNGKIFSFEPQSKAFGQLSKSAKSDSQWQIYNIGLGDSDGKTIINISKNSVSSSILDISQSLVETAPDTKYISKEEIQINRLDTFIKGINFTDRFFLKIDAQGFESKILEGAAGCFNNIYALQLELAYVPLYKEEKLFDEMREFIESSGFYLSSLESGFTDPQSGRLLQVEAIFLRKV
jgi:FkbM family methyltransferase